MYLLSSTNRIHLLIERVTLFHLDYVRDSLKFRTCSAWESSLFRTHERDVGPSVLVNSTTDREVQ